MLADWLTLRNRFLLVTLGSNIIGNIITNNKRVNKFSFQWSAAPWHVRGIFPITSLERLLSILWHRRPDWSFKRGCSYLSSWDLSPSCLSSHSMFFLWCSSARGFRILGHIFYIFGRFFDKFKINCQLSLSNLVNLGLPQSWSIHLIYLKKGCTQSNINTLIPREISQFQS